MEANISIKYHILLVEDDEAVIRAILRGLRRRTDIRVHVARDSTDARALYHARRDPQTRASLFCLIALDHDLKDSPESTTIPFLTEVLRPKSGDAYTGHIVTMASHLDDRIQMMQSGCDAEISLKSHLVGYVLGFLDRPCGEKG